MSDNNDNIEQLVKLSEISKITGLSKHILSKLCHSGKLPHTVINRRYYINKNDVIKLLQNCKKSSKEV